MPSADGQTRTLSDYIEIIRRRLAIIILVAIVCFAAAAVYTFRQPKVYESETKIVVGQGGGILSVTLGAQSDPLTQTMSNLLQSDEVARRVIQQLGLRRTPADVLSNMSVSTRPDTEVLDVFFRDTNREEGRRILATVGQVFSQLVSERLAPQAKGNPDLTITATVFDHAHYVLGQVQPKRVRNLAVALMLGLAFGVVAAFAREQLDDTIRTVGDAESAFGQSASVTLPVGLLGFRPLGRVSSKRHDPVLTELGIARLRASLMWSPQSRQAGTILVTSANPEEGKTTIAANLAVALARDGHSVIVVDADLRRPTLATYLATSVDPGSAGFDDLIRGERSISEACIPVSVQPALPTSPRGNGPVRPARGGAQLRAILAPPGHVWPSGYGMGRIAVILDELKRLATYVILDSPPILPVTDAYPLAMAADMVVAVVRNGKSSVPATASLAKALRRVQARHIELVITEAEPVSGAYSYYHVRSARSTVKASDPVPRRRRRTTARLTDPGADRSERRSSEPPAR